ncbi:plasmid stability [Cyanophage S-TIM54]|nr:plasmid stability [Cyanophage S-TIM54]
MQGLFNLMALTSFAVSASIVGGGVYLYQNKDRIITNVVDNAKAAVTEEITKALPGIIDSTVEIPEVPEMPKATGPAIPF